MGLEWGCWLGFHEASEEAIPSLPPIKEFCFLGEGWTRAVFTRQGMIDRVLVRIGEGITSGWSSFEKHTSLSE